MDQFEIKPSFTGRNRRHAGTQTGAHASLERAATAVDVLALEDDRRGRLTRHINIYDCIDGNVRHERFWDASRRFDAHTRPPELEHRRARPDRHTRMHPRRDPELAPRREYNDGGTTTMGGRKAMWHAHDPRQVLAARQGVALDELPDVDAYLRRLSERQRSDDGGHVQRAEEVLPRSDLLDALHGYTSRFVAKSICRDAEAEQASDDDMRPFSSINKRKRRAREMARAAQKREREDHPPPAADDDRVFEFDADAAAEPDGDAAYALSDTTLDGSSPGGSPGASLSTVRRTDGSAAASIDASPTTRRTTQTLSRRQRRHDRKHKPADTGYRFLSETVLLGFGVLIEELCNEAIGPTGHMVLAMKHDSRSDQPPHDGDASVSHTANFDSETAVEVPAADEALGDLPIDNGSEDSSSAEEEEVPSLIAKVQAARANRRQRGAVQSPAQLMSPGADAQVDQRAAPTHVTSPKRPRSYNAHILSSPTRADAGASARPSMLGVLSSRSAGPAQPRPMQRPPAARPKRKPGFR